MVSPFLTYNKEPGQRAIVSIILIGWIEHSSIVPSAKSLARPATNIFLNSVWKMKCIFENINYGPENK